MELVGRSLQERLGQALAVFVLFLVIDIVQNDFDTTFLVAVPVLFFLIMLVVDFVTDRLLGERE